MTIGTQEALSRFAVLVDPKIGIIRSVDVIKLSDLDPTVHLVVAQPSDTIPLAGITAANVGAACAYDLDRAVLRACGECVERYCSAFFDFDDLLLSSEEELRANGKSFVTTKSIYPFMDSQYASDDFPFERITDDRRTRWIQGQSIRGDEVWLPASCVFVPYFFESGQEAFTHMPISTGLAAGPSLEMCIEKGICEIIERDALMIVWYAKLPVPRIDPDSCYGLSEEIDSLLRSLRTVGTSWYLNLLNLDVDIPVISAALIDEGSPPLTSFGLAAHADPVEALRGALEEALLTRCLVNRSVDSIDKMNTESFGFRTLRDHMMAHAASDELRSRTSFLTSEGPIIDFAEILLKIDSRTSLQERCQAAGFDIFWVEVTTTDVYEMGIRVVRTIMPGLQPLDNDHRHRHLGGSRLLSVPRKLGHALRSIEDLNPDPHPFP